MTYAQQAFNYLLKHGKCTHKEIAHETNGNCSYSTIRDMLLLCRVRGIEITETWQKNEKTKKRYKQYEVA